MRGGWATRQAEAGIEAAMAGAAAFPRTVLAVLAALVIGSAWAATCLTVDTDSSRMLSPDLPFQERAHALNEAFPEIKNTIVVAVRGVRTDPVEAAVDALAKRLGGDPAVASVFAPSADPVLLANGLLYLDEAVLEGRLVQLSKASNLLAGLRADQSLQGFLKALDEAGRLAEAADLETEVLDSLYDEAAAVIEATAAGKTRGFAWLGAFEPTAQERPLLRTVAITPELDFTRLSPAKAALEAVEDAIAALDPAVRAEVELGVTGDPALRAEELQSVVSRLGLSLGLSLLIVAVVLWLALRTAGRVGVALGALVVTLVLTTGAGALAIGALNLVSVAFIVLMVGLGIDFAIHVMAHLDEDARLRPDEDPVRLTGRQLGPALILTATSTSAAFFAFTATDFIGMAQLGLIGGVGVLIAFAVAITLIPAVVALSPGLARGAPRGRLPRVGGTGRLGAWIAAAVGLGAIVLGSEARFDADPMSLRDPDARSVAVFDWLMAEPDQAPLRLSLLAPDAEAAEAAADRLDEIAEVHRAVWLGDLVPRDQDAKLDLIDLYWPSIDYAVNGPPVELADAREVTPESLAADLAGQGRAADRLAVALGRVAVGEVNTGALDAALFRYFPLLMDRLARQLDVAPMDVGDLPAAFRSRFLAADGRYRVDIVPSDDIRIPAARAAFVRAVAETAPEAAGPPAQIVGASGTVAAAMAEASAIALGATALLAMLALASVTLVAAILVPVVLAGAVTMAASVLLGLPFNYANIIVLPLLIGIGVDSGIHLALRTLRHGSVFDTATPRAVFYSALTTIGAFSTLALSEHRGTASMGVMLAIALIAAIVMSFALTPALVRLATGRRVE